VSNIIFIEEEAGGANSTGWMIAGAGASEDTGGPVWGTPSRVTADDGTDSACNFTSAVESDSLVASSFGLAVPGGATIVGVSARVQLSRGVISGVTYTHVNIGKDSSTLGTPKNPGVTLTTTPTNYDDGGASDLWGLSLSVAEVNASTFQVRVRCTRSGILANAANCDAIWVNVHYTGP
jgi:hypothetical protein